MFSKRSQEGVFLIDHRNSPGISAEFVKKNNIGGPIVGAGQTYESAILTCHGCQGDIIINPKRTRDRAYCMTHDAYLCDHCDARRAAAGGTCIPLRQVMEQLYNKLMKRPHV